MEAQPAYEHAPLQEALTAFHHFEQLGTEQETSSPAGGIAMAEPRRSFSFDPTINLGHVLTFCGFIVTGFIGYSSLERRVALVEQMQRSAIETAADKSSLQNQALQEMRQDIKDTQRSIAEISRMLAARGSK